MTYRQLPIGQTAIQERVHQLARDIKRAQGEGPLVLIGILDGCFVFLADLIRALDNVNTQVRTLRVSSYMGTACGRLRVHDHLDGELIRGHPVLVVDDIADSHRTLRTVVNAIWECKPTTVETAVIVRKPSRLDPHHAIEVDYVGFDIADRFVVGYGMDYKGWYRNLPYIGALTRDANGRLTHTGSQLGPRFPDQCGDPEVVSV